MTNELLVEIEILKEQVRILKDLVLSDDIHDTLYSYGCRYCKHKVKGECELSEDECDQTDEQALEILLEKRRTK